MPGASWSGCTLMCHLNCGRLKCPRYPVAWGRVKKRRHANSLYFHARIFGSWNRGESGARQLVIFSHFGTRPAATELRTYSHFCNESYPLDFFNFSTSL